MSFNTNFGFDDDLFDDDQILELKTKADINPIVTQEQANLASKLANTYPNLPPSVIAAAAQMRMALDDPNLEEIAKKVALQKEESFNKIKRFMSENPMINTVKNNKFYQLISSPLDNILKPTTRTLVAGFSDIYEAIFPAMARANEIQDQSPGTSFSEAYKQAIKGTLRTPKMVEAIRSGDTFDMGRGWLKLSTNPSDTDEYKRLVAGGFDPMEAREYVLENVLGTQIDIESRETAENVVQFQGELGKQFQKAGLNPSVSPGRKIFQELGFYNLYEPGTKTAQRATGALDVGFQILSPENWVTFGAAKIKDARKMFQVAERLTDAGILTTAVRSSFHGPTLKAYLSSSKGRNFKKLLWEKNITEIMTRTKGSITDPKFFDDLKKLDGRGKRTFDATAEKQLDNFLSETIYKDAVDKAEMVPIGARLITASNMYVPDVVRGNALRTKLGLYFAPAYGKLVDASNPTEALDNLYKFSIQSRSFIGKTEDGIRLSDKFLDDAVEALSVDGDKGAALSSVVSNFLEGDFAKLLKEKNVNEDVIEAVTKISRQFSDDAEIAADMNKGLYGIDSQGNKFPINDVLKANGVDATEVNRALYTTQLNNNVFLPDLNKVIKAANQMDTFLRGNASKVLGNLGGKKTKESQEALIRFLDWYNSDVFKPLALLKPAWTVKVVGEEQIRLVSRGLMSLPLAPIQIIARMFGRSVGDKSKLRKGVDPLLPSESVGGYWASDLAFQNSLTGINNVRTMRRKQINPSRWEQVAKGSKDYNPAVVRTVYQIVNDPLARDIARIDRLDVSWEAKETMFRHLANGLRKGQNRERLQQVVGDASHPFHKALDSTDVAEEYIYYLRANVHSSLGGNVLADSATSSKNWVESQAIDELLDMVANGGAFVTKEGKKMNFMNVASMAKNKAKNTNEKIKKKIGDKDFDQLAEEYIAGKLSDEELKAISPLFKEAQDDLVSGFISTFDQSLPTVTRGFIPPSYQKEGLYNKAINAAFDILMTQNTNKLSRSPAFRRLYWKRVSETIEFLGKEGRDEMQKLANEALKEYVAYDPKLRGYLSKINKAGYSGSKEAITDTRLYDKMVASDALTQTKKLLYDVSERTMLGDSLRFAFPFLEAYLEIFKTWTDITKRAGGKNLINVNKLVQSGTEPSPLADPTGQRGFFYTNPINGEEVFAYPGTGLIQKHMFPELQETGVDAEFPVYVSSLNLVADVMPGVGPIIRVPAAYLRKNFPEEGSFNQFIFGDFLPPQNFIEGAVPFPAWLKKFYQAYKAGGSGSADLNRQFNNTVIDTYKAMIYAGVIDDSTPEGTEEGLALATKYARRIFMIRGASQLIGPAGAASPIWSVTDKSGNALFVEALADTYRDYKASADGDDYEATNRFIKEFGLDPTALITSKSKSVIARPTTVFAAEWARDNEDLYDEFNTTAFYLTPTDVDADFSYDAYLTQLDEGTLVPRTPEQWAMAKNRLLGSIAYENYLRNTKVDGKTLLNINTKEAQLLKWIKQADLMEQYWGYGQRAGFDVGKPDTDFLLQEMGGETYLPDRKSTFKVGWIKEDYTPIDKLKDNNAAIAYGKYRKEYDAIMKESINQGFSPSSFKTSQQLVPVRQYLRKLATKLIIEHPEFGPLWNSILEPELREEVADEELLGF